MKKEFKEPVLLVEDFTMSEMVARNCGITPGHITVVQQMSHKGCYTGDEDKFTYEQQQIYSNSISELYEGRYDLDNNALTTENCFTKAYYEASGQTKGVCSTQPTQLFGHGIECTEDTTLLQNS